MTLHVDGSSGIFPFLEMWWSFAFVWNSLVVSVSKHTLKTVVDV